MSSDSLSPLASLTYYTYYSIGEKKAENFRAYNNDPINNYFPNLRIECTNDIYNVLKAHNIPTLQYIDCMMGHGLAKVKPWNICSTDFGKLTPITLNQVNEYMAARACFFFQSILHGNASMLQEPSKFTDCLDSRDGGGVCANIPNNDTCTNEKECPKKQE